jgi:hypothetical protein
MNIRIYVSTFSIPLTNLRKNRFNGCKSLCEIVFESGSKLKKIGDSAFSYSRIKAIRILNNVERIGEHSFLVCIFLSAITFEGFPSIGTKAFTCRSLKCVNIAKSAVLRYEFPVNCTVHVTDLCEKE